MCQGLFNVIRGFGDPLTEVARREHSNCGWQLKLLVYWDRLRGDRDLARIEVRLKL